MPADQAAAKLDIGFVSENMRLYSAASLRWHMEFVRSIYPRWDRGFYAIHVIAHAVCVGIDFVGLPSVSKHGKISNFQIGNSGLQLGYARSGHRASPKARHPGRVPCPVQKLSGKPLHLSAVRLELAGGFDLFRRVIERERIQELSAVEERAVCR